MLACIPGGLVVSINPTYLRVYLVRMASRFSSRLKISCSRSFSVICSRRFLSSSSPIKFSSRPSSNSSMSPSLALSLSDTSPAENHNCAVDFRRHFNKFQHISCVTSACCLLYNKQCMIYSIGVCRDELSLQQLFITLCWGRH